MYSILRNTDFYTDIWKLGKMDVGNRKPAGPDPIEICAALIQPPCD